MEMETTQGQVTIVCFLSGCSPDKERMVRQLCTARMKMDEIKCLARRNRNLEAVDIFLRRKDKLMCMLQTFRRKLANFVADIECSKQRNVAMCKITRYLDSMDRDLTRLCEVQYPCYAGRSSPSTCASQGTAPDSTFPSPCSSPKSRLPQQKSGASRPQSRKCASSLEQYCDSDAPPLCSATQMPRIYEEVLRPFCPGKDEDCESIHLRYIPELGSFKARMAQNPCALRLPLMCSSMKRIMNKMKADYLMDDVPICVPNLSSKGGDS